MHYLRTRNLALQWWQDPSGTEAPADHCSVQKNVGEYIDIVHLSNENILL